MLAWRFLPSSECIAGAQTRTQIAAQPTSIQVTAILTGSNRAGIRVHDVKK